METSSYCSFGSQSIDKPRMTPVFILSNTSFDWSPSIGKPRMTPVSFVKTTKSYVKTTESYEVCRLGHIYRIETGLIAATDQTVRAVHYCNSWFAGIFTLFNTLSSTSLNISVKLKIKSMFIKMSGK